MRWWLFLVVMATATLEGLIAVNWPVLGVKLPLTWICLYLITLHGWTEWQRGLIMAVCAGYLLDVLTAPIPGAVVIPLIAAWTFATVVTAKKGHKRSNRVLALFGGSLIYFGGSTIAGSYFPGWALIWMAALYTLVTAAAYLLIRLVAVDWLKRV